MPTYRLVPGIQTYFLHLSHALLTLDLSFASRLLFAGGLFSPPKVESDALTALSDALVGVLPVTGAQPGDDCCKGAPSAPPSIVYAGFGKTGVISKLGGRVENYPVFPGWRR